MSGTSSYVIPGELTDKVVIDILKKELPAALQRMNVSKPLSDSALEDFAFYLADYAKACDQDGLNKIREAKTIQLVKQPTPEQCKDLEEFLQQVVRIGTVSKDYKTKKHLIRNNVGKIWSFIHEDKDWDKNTPNAVVGVRG
jgi:hypothetical protein